MSTPKSEAQKDAEREWFLREYAHLISPWMFHEDERKRRDYAILERNWKAHA